MIDKFLFIPLFISFFIVLFTIPIWISKAKQIGLMWDDMNKVKSDKVAGSGGIVVLLGFVASILVFIAYRVFILKDTNEIISIFALLLVVVLASGIGFVDDLLGWQHGGLSKKSRIFLVILASVPLIAINAGVSEISFPFLGTINFGLFYPLFLIPLGILATTTTFNMLAGFNGLEAGQGIIFLSAISLVAYFTGNSWLSMIGFCMVLSLLAFLFFNFHPAKIFPGDCLTYAVGSLIGVMSILGNFEKIAAFFYIPYILEVILKSRGGLKKQSFGKPGLDGSLDMKYDKVYGLEHFAIWLLKSLWIKPTEKRVVYLIWAFQLIIILIGFIIFSKGIFLI